MPEPKESRQSEMWDAREAGPPGPAPEEGAAEPPREPRLKRV
jgi:hypothetical protein